ncbi:MAG: hypothetical protein QW394_10265, partial [Thermofilaceae archaeon]
TLRETETLRAEAELALTRYTPLLTLYPAVRAETGACPYVNHGIIAAWQLSSFAAHIARLERRGVNIGARRALSE